MTVAINERGEVIYRTPDKWRMNMEEILKRKLGAERLKEEDKIDLNVAKKKSDDINSYDITI